MSSEQDAVELAQQELALARMGDEMDMANWAIDYADALIQALEAQRRETRRITERLQEIVNKNGWEVEAWGKDTLDVIEAKLQAQDKEKEWLRNILAGAVEAAGPALLYVDASWKAASIGGGNFVELKHWLKNGKAALEEGTQDE